MPKIKFIRLVCPGCGESYKFSLYRVADGKPFACPACPEEININEAKAHLDEIFSYNEAVGKVEEKFNIDGDTAIYREETGLLPYFENPRQSYDISEMKG